MPFFYTSGFVEIQLFVIIWDTNRTNEFAYSLIPLQLQLLITYIFDLQPSLSQNLLGPNACDLIFSKNPNRIQIPKNIWIKYLINFKQPISIFIPESKWSIMFLNPLNNFWTQIMKKMIFFIFINCSGPCGRFSQYDASLRNSAP